MRISNETIERIHQQLDIIDVVGDFVSLKKKGMNYWACCPFHNEKSPSFAVNPAKGIFKCFGCGKSGDAITFVQQLEGLSYIEAMKYFAKKYGIEIQESEARSEEDLRQQNERDGLYIVLNYAKNYFADLLHNHEDGQSIGLSYFRERGFSETTIKKFELGYSLDQWDGLLKEATKNGYSIEMLEKAGLILARENANDRQDRKHYDRFRGRVVFPIHNLSGKPIAFGARILKNDKNQPKYINSPETEVYHKSKILYGIFQAKNAIRNEDNCFLVEGYTDVISLHQAGVENVVASSGTSLTEDQIRLIKRYSENITVLYDGDPAGIKASLRGIDMILEEGLNVNVVLFPDNDDPDSYVRKIGGEKFKAFIKEHKKDFISFKTELYLQEAADDPIKKAGIIKDIVTSISKIPDGIKRALFFRQCSKLMEIDEQVLISEYNKVELKRRQDKSKKNETPPEFINYQEGEEIPLLIEDPATEPDADRLMAQLQDHETSILKLIINLGGEMIEGHRVVEYLLTETQDVESSNPLYLKIRNAVVEELNKGNEITKAFFLENEDEELKTLAIDLMVEKYQISDRWEKFGIIVPKDQELLEQNTPKAVLKYKRLFAKYLIREKRKELTHGQEAEKEMQVLQEILTLQQFEKQIDKMLGIIVG
ncbi:MAG TPA: DNA primase [Cytophagaceae bacterium]|nr:DNA primase [Cytophagaceae bacterium]